jgi:osmotically-inducible protein OsmY
VKNGVVQLTGQVASMSDEFDAVRAARSVKGVRNVVDQLKLDDKKMGDRSGT